MAARFDLLYPAEFYCEMTTSLNVQENHLCFSEELWTCEWLLAFIFMFHSDLYIHYIFVVQQKFTTDALFCEFILISKVAMQSFCICINKRRMRINK